MFRTTKKLIIISIVFTIIHFYTESITAQNITERLTLDEVIQLSQEQSLQSIIAKHRFRASYWKYRSYLAKYLPMLTLNSDILDFNRSITKNAYLENGNWIEVYGENKSLNSSAGLSLSQNIGFTGGNIFLNSQLARNDQLEGDSLVSYLSNPISIGFRQPLNGYNELRWEKKIEPKRYEEARKDYIQAMEDVSATAVSYFFDFILAKINLDIANINYQNSDTIYKIAQGRYQIGTIAEDELLQLELSHLNAGLTLNKSTIDYQANQAKLRSFLGFNNTVNIELILPDKIPALEIDLEKAMEQAKKNNPRMIGLALQLLEAQQSVASAKAQRGLNADLYASFGLTQTAKDIPGVYKDPLDQQVLQVGIQVPLVDWGLSRGQFKLAQSNNQVIASTVEQANIDFEQDVVLNVMQFNLQDDQLLIAAKADTVANFRYNISKQRFMIGKISVLDLNVALEEKDVARRNYISSLREYWSFFYNMRKLTLYDFITNSPISAEYDQLTEKTISD